MLQEDNRPIAAVENEISYHAQKLLSLRVQSNRLLPVGRLPPEILSKIFLHCRDVSDTAYFPSNSAYRWTFITHVCHYWREVGLSTPHLWSVIHLGCISRSFAEALVLRSKAAPLYLDADPGNRPYMDGLLQITTPLLHRARTIRFELKDKLYEAFPSEFSAEASELQELSLRPDCSQTTRGYVPPPLPIFLTRCNAPQLKVLEVSLYTIPWNLVRLPSTLARLTIINPSRQSTVSEVVAAVLGLTALQYLFFEDIFASAPFAAEVDGSVQYPKVTTRLTLAHMTEIWMAGSAIECIHFLDHLVLPHPATVDFEALHPITNVPASAVPSILAPLASFLPLGLGSNSDCGADTLQLDPLYIILKREAPLSSDRADPDFKAFLDVGIGGDEEAVVLLSGLCSQRRLVGITKLVIIGQDIRLDLNVSWMVIFESLPDLKTISFVAFQEPHEIGLPGFIKTVVDHDELLPNLRALLFESVHFLPHERLSHPGTTREPVHATPEKEENSNSLISDMCCTFGAHPGRIEVVVLINCSYVKKVDIANLEKVVPHVKWEQRSTSRSQDTHWHVSPYNESDLNADLGNPK
ncbi:hypothetical protein EIP91_009345 [Steccherinum ochraceum]|uniref:Uncharacterized protein n=1 Tax=Steccherinum ochraceum TaxID=92696 RepID=A0A4R0RRQ7_9APHY|nr:hypothetical protein EIP91_009345 [Steccherinum ochraceum]